MDNLEKERLLRAGVKSASPFAKAVPAEKWMDEVGRILAEQEKEMAEFRDLIFKL